MPLHLLGKKSWNVYNTANIARVKADEAAAAAQEAADEQRMQGLDAERRAAILRGQEPPPLPEEDIQRGGGVGGGGGKRADKDKDKGGHDRKRRRIAGEDDTDRDIRLARTATEPGDAEKVSVLKLRKPQSDAPLTDHAGNINLFPVDLKEVVKREKNAEAEKEKRRKEKSFEDQYTMRFSNAAGKDGLEQKPWYTASGLNTAPPGEDGTEDRSLTYPGYESKDVWGNEDPRRKERQRARITSNDPLAFMNRAQVQLKKSREDRKKWASEKDRELRELRAAEERELRRDRHGKRKRKGAEDEHGSSSQHRYSEKDVPKHKYRRRSRSRSHERKHDYQSSHRHSRKHDPYRSHE